MRSIGDPKDDAIAIEWASPALHVDKIKIPILLMHGEDDDRWTPEHERQRLEETIAFLKPFLD